jgi:HSP20 family molecular chaperone IbpA
MNAIKISNSVSQSFNDLWFNSVNGCQQSTLWICNTEEVPITAITIHELETKLILKIHIYDIHLFNLSLKITPETILLQGEPTEEAGVKGYFRPNGFESLIPLPHVVQPERCWAQIQTDGLTIHLVKQLRFQQSKIQIQLPRLNSLDSVDSVIG